MGKKKRKKHQTGKQKKKQYRTISEISTKPQIKPKDVQKSQKTKTLISFSKKIVGYFLGLLAILGFCIGIYTFYPRVSIQETTLLQPQNPFYYPFLVKNMGNIRVINFTYILKIDDMNLEGNSHIKGNALWDFSYTIPKIEINGSHPIDLTKTIEIPFPYIINCQIYIQYKYSIPIFKKTHFIDSTRFVLHRDYQNNFKWIEYQY